MARPGRRRSGRSRPADQSPAGCRRPRRVVLFDALNSEGFFAAARAGERWLIAQDLAGHARLAKPTPKPRRVPEDLRWCASAASSAGVGLRDPLHAPEENVRRVAKPRSLGPRRSAESTRHDRTEPAGPLTPDQEAGADRNTVNSIQGVGDQPEKIMGQGSARVAERLPDPATPGADQHRQRRHDARQPSVVQRTRPRSTLTRAWTADLERPSVRRSPPLTSTRPVGRPEHRRPGTSPRPALHMAHGVPPPAAVHQGSINPARRSSARPRRHTQACSHLAAAEKTCADLKDTKEPAVPSTPLRQRPWALTVRTTTRPRTSGATKRTGGPSTSIRTPTRT
jgi:hypothetical protein